MKPIGISLFLLFALAACDSTTGPGAGDVVQVKFRSSGLGVMPVAPAGPAMSPETLGQTAVEGPNGTLDLEGVWFIVAEFKLEGDPQGEDKDCPGMESDDCYEFEAPPFFVELPLEDGSVSVATDEVPAGVYHELQFEIEDLDDGDEEDGRGASELVSQIRAIHPDWPEDASLLVVGTFTPKEGGPRSFRVYVDAEVEIEGELNHPLRVEDDGTPGTGAIVVEIDPWAWFRGPDGTVWDLSEFDYGRTGELLQLEAEMEHGFLHVGIEEDDG